MESRDNLRFGMDILPTYNFKTEHFINPILITTSKDGSIKLAMDAKPLNAQIWKKNKRRHPRTYRFRRSDHYKVSALCHFAR